MAVDLGEQLEAARLAVGVAVVAQGRATVLDGAADEVARIKTGQAERIVRRMIEGLILDGLSTEQISAIFVSALAAKGGTS